MSKFKPKWQDDATSVPDESILHEICARLCNREDLIVILREEGMPSPRVFYKWLGMYPEWRTAYKEALQVKMHGYIEETIQIADETNPKLVKKAELQVKARQWAAERLNRDAFGDPKTSVTVNGNVQITHNSIHQLLTEGTGTPHIIDIPSEQEVISAAEEGTQMESGENGAAGDAPGRVERPGSVVPSPDA